MNLGKGYQVKFVHFGPPLGLLNDVPWQRATGCFLTIPGGDLLVGTASCSKKDRFVRAKGRELALARALKNLPKDERKLVWHLYFAAVSDDRAHLLLA